MEERCYEVFRRHCGRQGNRELNDLGLVDGVTTNPSLILKSGRDILEVTKEICSFVKGPGFG
jgi:transaldolase